MSRRLSKFEPWNCQQIEWNRSNCSKLQIKEGINNRALKCKVGTGDFLFSGLAVHPHVSGENGHRKRTPEWGFLKTPASRLRVDGRKRSFSNTIHGTNCRLKQTAGSQDQFWIKRQGRLIEKMRYYESYVCSASDALVFPLYNMRFRVIRIRYVWKRIFLKTQKNTDTCG